MSLCQLMSDNFLIRSNTVETLKETIPGAFVNEQYETDEYVDSVDSQVSSN